jgi:GNAT superfamily N-acetyltransferase
MRAEGKARDYCVRRARSQDRKDILRICRATWHGWDYVPEYLNRWLKEKGFYVIVERRTGRAVGLGKYTELAPGELWLEGLRIDPEARSRGLGWQLSKAVLRHALAEKPVSIRLATGRRNTHSRRIIRRMGLRLRVSLWSREGKVPRRAGKPDVFVPSARAAYDYLRRSDECRAGKGLLAHTWQFRTATPELIAELHRKGCLFGYGHKPVGPTTGRAGRNDDLQGLLILQPGRYRTGRLDICFIGGTRKALPEFARQIRVFARRRRCTSIGGMAASPKILRHLGGLRMRVPTPRRRGSRVPGGQRHVMVYEYPLPHSTSRSGHHIPRVRRKA